LTHSKASPAFLPYFSYLSSYQIAKDLLLSLKQEKLVLDWRKRQQSKASVEVTIRDMLDSLPDGYSGELYDQMCQTVYQHVYESYAGAGVSIYGPTSQ
jgi:type I restriction enzyme, R subunit